jgi:YD repeat-containing protein
MSTETYDANGNTLTSGGRNFAYDSENRLTSMNSGAVSIVYDGFGNRVAETAGGVTTKYLVEDDVNPTGLPGGWPTHKTILGAPFMRFHRMSGVPQKRTRCRQLSSRFG